jgi:amino acid transporter
MAKDGQAPRIFANTTPGIRNKKGEWILKGGAPLAGVVLAGLFSCIGFLNAKQSAADVFMHLVSFSTVLGALNWINILLAYFGWCLARQAQGLRREDLIYRGWGQPYTAMFSLFMTSCVILTTGKTSLPFGLSPNSGPQAQYFV